jgi:hypothetical protein
MIAAEISGGNYLDIETDLGRYKAEIAKFTLREDVVELRQYRVTPKSLHQLSGEVLYDELNVVIYEQEVLRLPQGHAQSFRKDEIKLSAIFNSIKKGEYRPLKDYFIDRGEYLESRTTLQSIYGNENGPIGYCLKVVGNLMEDIGKPFLPPVFPWDNPDRVNAYETGKKNSFSKGLPDNISANSIRV